MLWDLRNKLHIWGIEYHCEIINFSYCKILKIRRPYLKKNLRFLKLFEKTGSSFACVKAAPSIVEILRTRAIQKCILYVVLYCWSSHFKDFLSTSRLIKGSSYFRDITVLGVVYRTYSMIQVYQKEKRNAMLDSKYSIDNVKKKYFWFCYFESVLTDINL